MLFIYSVYEHLIKSKDITASLKNEPEPQQFTLNIITPAREFLGLPFGGGLVKLSRLYDQQGNLINTTRYSPELKKQIKEFKKECPIPYFRLWKGFIFVAIALAVGSIIYGVKNKIESDSRAEKTAYMVERLNHIENGQLYGASFFIDSKGNNIDGLPEGWIKIIKVEGDTIFLQRSKQTIPTSGLFTLENIVPILPQSKQEWDPTIEKLNYNSIRSQMAESPARGSVDALYIGTDLEKYNGVVLSIKAAK